MPLESRRKTDRPDGLPVGLSDEFASDAAKRTQWAAFIRRTPLRIAEGDLGVVVTGIRGLLMPPVTAVTSGNSFDRRWPKGGPWGTAESGHRGHTNNRGGGMIRAGWLLAGGDHRDSENVGQDR